MQSSFFEAICRLGIFMICVRAILHFSPQEIYEKYLRLLAGIMILIQLFLPVGKLILGKGGQEAAETLKQFRQELEQSMEEAVENAAAADALLEQMTMEEVQRRLEEQGAAEQEEETDAAGAENEREAGAVGAEQDGKAGTAETGRKEGAVNEMDAADTKSGITVELKAVEQVSVATVYLEQENE